MDVFDLCRRGDVDALSEYLQSLKSLPEGGLDKVKEVVNEVDMEDDEMTPLLICATSGFHECLLELIHRGAELDSQSQFCMTACYLAASRGHHECLDILIRHGADVMVPAMNDLPINAALRKSHRSCVQLLLEGGDYNSVTNLYHDAVDSRNLEMCFQLLNHGYGHSDGIHESRSPLHTAAYEGLLDMVEFLVNHGADLELKDKEGRTPLLAATSSGHVNVVKKLIDVGCNINAKDNTYSELSAVHIAAQLGHMKCLMELIKAGVDVDICDNRGLTPLMRTIASGDTQPAVLIIRENACLLKVTKQDSFNDALRRYLSVVDIAIVSRMFTIAELLLKCGASFTEELFNFPEVEMGKRDWHPLRRILASNNNGENSEIELFCKWYSGFKRNPSTLKHLSRLHIRSCLNSPLSKKLHQLPLPKAIQSYLYLDDLIDERLGGECSTRREDTLAYYMPALWINHDPNIYA